MTDYTKGDICLVDFNTAKGGEIGKLRPAVIMSSKDELHALSTAIVIPLSTVIEPDTQPYRVFLPKREHLDKDSDICIYEIRSLSKQRIKKKVTSLSKKELQTVKKALCEILEQ